MRFLALLLGCAALPLAAQSPAKRALDPNVLAAENYMAKGDFRKALEALNLTIGVDPKTDPEVYVMLAVSYVNLDDSNSALDACEKGLAQFPKSRRIAGYYAALVQESLSPSEAAARLERMTGVSPNSPELQKALGRALLDRKTDDPRTAALLDAARKALPGDPEAHFLYGRWACLHQKEAACVQSLQRSLALGGSKNPQAALLTNGMIGLAEERLNRPARAKAAYRLAMEAYGKTDPPAPEVPFQYARFLAERSEYGDAKAVLSEILQRNPRFGPAHLEMAKALVRDGEKQKAAESAELALKFGPPEREHLRAAHAFLIKTYSALGREADAKPHRDWIEANP
jgi:tetratricopeptide (TPR) repeat protein